MLFHWRILYLHVQFTGAYIIPIVPNLIKGAFDMKILRKIITWVLILAVAATAVWFFFLRKEEVRFTEETARTADIETFYTFTGNVESSGVQVYSSSARSKVKEWLVEEGDEVTTSDSVVRYESGTVVKSPMNGTISDLYLSEGDEFNPGTPLFRIADYSEPLINFRVDEYDVHALKKGMDVSVRVLSSGKELKGEITRVSQEATVVGDLAFYAVRATLPQDGSLPMGVSCEIIVPRESAMDVTTVSMSAIQYDDDGEPFVYCYDRNNEIVEQRVELGINDGSIVEIREGLRSGETVLIPPSFGFDPMAMRERMMGGGR